MPESLFTQPAYEATFTLIFLVWVTLDIYESVTRRANGAVAVISDGGSLQLLRVGLRLSILAAVLLAYRAPARTLPGLRPWLFIAGSALVLTGLALRRWAIVVLGRYFTLDVAVLPDQVVVDAPPYRRVRHPAYSGSILSLLGAGLMLGHWLGLCLIVLAIVVTFSYRVRLEERVLLNSLGRPYADYMRRTKRFVPFLW